MPKRLTPDQVASFHRDGFITPVRVFSEQQAAEFRQEFEQIERAQGGALKGIARTKIYLRHPSLYRLATDPAILDMVEDLIGPDILLYQNADAAHPTVVDNNTITGIASGKGIVVTDDGAGFGETAHVGTTYATLTRNTVRFASAHTMTLLATPTQIQQRTFDLLDLKPQL